MFNVQLFTPDHAGERSPRSWSFAPPHQPRWMEDFQTLELALVAVVETAQWALSAGYSKFVVVVLSADDPDGLRPVAELIVRGLKLK